jgi:hypothetical protein
VFRRVCKLHINPTPAFHVDVVVTGVPFQASSTTTLCTLSYDTSLSSEKMMESFEFDWMSLLGLLRLMRRFKAFLDTKPHLAAIKYQVKYNLKSVHILYGPDLQLRMSLSWDRKEEKLLLEFHGQKGGLWNPHRMLKAKLMELINPRRGAQRHLVDFSHIFDILAHTTPIVLAARDSTRPVGIVKVARSLTPQVTFQFIPLSLSHFVLIWKGLYCVSLKVLAGPKFLVTDVGATDIARKSTDLEGRYLPLPGLKLLVETALGQNGFPDGGMFDQDLQVAIGKFFSRLRGYPVHVTSTSNFPS